MKRNILSLLIFCFAMVQAMGQTYDNLWKQAATIQQKDLPKSELAVMEKIITKASSTKDYGQLLAAELRRVVLWNAISPDSLEPNIKRLQKMAADETDPMLKAVRYAALGKLCRESKVDMDGDENVANVYFKKALEKPELLASHISTEYVPLTLKGMDGTTFGNDMLHLVGFEADTKEAYQLMFDYYNKVGKRGAACLCAFELTQKDRFEDVKEVRKSKYLNTIDSLIHVYQDIPEAGELAVEHYRFMEGATDAKPLDKMNYINFALNKWGGWSRMNVLRNALKRLTEPMFVCEGLPTVIRPGQQQWLKVKVRNLQSLKLTLSRLNITADNDYNVDDENTYKLLKTKTNSFHQKDFAKSFYGHPNYEVVTDSFEIANLPLGTYLLEVTSDNASIKPQRTLFYVSDLALMSQQLPDDSHRYVVVSATTGQPIAGAQISILDRKYDTKKKKDKRVVVAQLTTDENGEANYKNVDGDILVSTNQDKYTPARWTYLSHIRYYDQRDNRKSMDIFTDRAIYRPGQTVHASAICWSVENNADAKALDKESLHFVLRDANWKSVAEKQAVTDEYGSASVDFELPQGGLTGNYCIQVRELGGSAHFRVEEYKRPTFEITFPQVNQKYAWGDTVVLKATAKTYAGMPVQGARVNYNVTRRNQLWWWGNRSAPLVVMKGEGITKEDGTFDVEIPLEAFPADHSGSQNMNEFMRKAQFFSFDVKAVVTDLSGESHEGEMSLPLGTRSAVLSVNIPKRIEVDSLKNVIFSYRNASGMDISGTVRYRIDEGEWANVGANEEVVLPTLPSGVHSLVAICEQDTLRQNFTLFSMSDTHPMEKTVHWSYQTSDVFPQDGKPVYVQVGSSENGAHIVYSIIAGNKLLEKGAWEIGDSIVTLPFTYQSEYASGVVINYSFVKEGVCYGNRISIARPLPEKKLNVSWKSFRNRLTPGQKEEWTLSITTPDGKPAKAQLLSVLYDKSLDQLMKHTWNLSLGFYRSLPNCYWQDNLGVPQITLGSSYPTKYYEEKDLDVDKFASKLFQSFYIMQAFELCEITVMDKAGAKNMVKSRSYKMAAPTVAAVRNDSMVLPEESVGAASNASLGNGMDEDTTNKALDHVTLRENLNETAFFYPSMESDDKGNVRLKFTLPESVTTWKFMGLAHDKEMRNGLLVDEAVAKKTVMVQPNLPRFLRAGDKATIAVKVFNSSDKKVGGDARMQIIDPETNKVVWQRTQKFNLDANATVSLDFAVSEMKEGIYIYKVVAAGNGYSDGEQHYLPVLTNSELVTNTLPLTLHEKGVTKIDLSSLFSDKNGKLIKNTDKAKITIEYTNHPSWLMIQALPSVSNPTNDDNAISLMTAIYSNSIARHIMTQSPTIKQVVQLWKNEMRGDTQNGESSLMSNLEKNQELKNVILSETPWVMDADKESEQKRQLANYFDESMNAQRLTSQLAKLKALQNPDGSFSWWKGMSGSRYMTTAIAKMMARLHKMIGVQEETEKMLTSALDYLQRKAAEEVRNMKKEEAKSKVLSRPSEAAMDYLYIRALDDGKLSASGSSDKDYLVKRMMDKNAEYTIYGKALAAVVLAQNGYRKEAAEYLQSIEEYSVSNAEMGRYFDTRKAYYSWNDYKIPTEVAAIEAIQLLGVEAQKAFVHSDVSPNVAVEEMKRWLLQSKRTQSWDTPVNCVDAVYAFMNGKESVLEVSAENVSLTLDGKKLSMPKATVGLGYVKTSREGIAQQLVVDKKSDHTSWGAVYAQFSMPMSEIANAASGIKIERRIVASSDQSTKKSTGNLKAEMGEKVKVILLITADRDYDFVQIVDKRAACLEPTHQLSGYQWGLGCYVSPRDYTTNFYFDRLSKGKHTLEMEYYVDRKGDYHAGTCTVQCAYSPEFGGRTEAYQMTVNK